MDSVSERGAVEKGVRGGQGTEEGLLGGASAVALSRLEVLSRLESRSTPSLVSPPSPSLRSGSESHGFTLYLASLILFTLFLAWAYLPPRTLSHLGVTWYPSQEWAILVPSWTIVCVVFVYWTYSVLALFATPPLDALTTLTDSKAVIPEDASLRSLDNLHDPASIPMLHDVPVSLVNSVQFGSAVDAILAERSMPS